LVIMLGRQKHKRFHIMIICGRKEMKSGTVSVRKHGGKDLGAFTIEEFVKMIKSESSEKLDV